MKKELVKRLPILIMPAICFSLASCSSTSNDGDLKTYSFLVEFFDDSEEAQKVGYAYVSYGQKVTSISPYENSEKYDEKSKQRPNRGKRFETGFRNIDWQGKYQDIDTSLPPYEIESSETGNTKTPPLEGEEVDISFIKGNCSLYAHFKEEPIQYRSLFHSSSSLIKGDDEKPFGYEKIYDWGETSLLPAAPDRSSKYGYKSDFKGFGFKEGSLDPFSSLEDAKFYYGEGDPSELNSYSSDDGTSVSHVPTGSLYEDLSAKDENGHYTLDLYGYDGEWTKLGSGNSNKPIEIHYYANFTDDYKRNYEVKVFSSYDDFSKQSNATSLWGEFSSQITFSDDFKTVNTNNSVSQTNFFSLAGDKKVRAWRGYYANNVIYENRDGASLGKEGSEGDEKVIEAYAGKMLLGLDSENAVLAPASIFPIYSDCSIQVYDDKGEKAQNIDIAYGSPITFSGTTITTKDAEGKSHSVDLGYTLEECLATYSKNGLNDITLPTSCKEEDYSLALDKFEPILGDIELHKKSA